ncbi:MAG: hypothetical protein AABY03_00650 [Nanoarchaeota archaeon]
MRSSISYEFSDKHRGEVSVATKTYNSLKEKIFPGKPLEESYDFLFSGDGRTGYRNQHYGFEMHILEDGTFIFAEYDSTWNQNGNREKPLRPPNINLIDFRIAIKPGTEESKSRIERILKKHGKFLSKVSEDESVIN